MDEEIKAQIIPIIENTKEGIAKAVEVMQRELPELVHEILLWNGIKSGLLFLFGVILFIVSIIYFKRWFNKADWIKGDRYVIGSLISALGSVVGAMFFSVNLAWSQIIVAPRLFLVEYIMGLMQ